MQFYDQIQTIRRLLPTFQQLQDSTNSLHDCAHTIVKAILHYSVKLLAETVYCIYCFCKHAYISTKLCTYYQVAACVELVLYNARKSDDASQFLLYTLKVCCLASETRCQRTLPSLIKCKYTAQIFIHCKNFRLENRYLFYLQDFNIQ